MIHLLIRMGCISTPFLFYQSFVCVCRHERHRLSLFLYIYTHGKSSPSSHTKREQMIDNLAEKRRACRPMSRCGQKAKKFSFFFEMGSSDHTIAPEYLDLFIRPYLNVLAINSSDILYKTFCFKRICSTHFRFQM